MWTKVFIYPVPERFLIRCDMFIESIEYILHAGVRDLGLAIDDESGKHLLCTLHEEVFFSVFRRVLGDGDGDALRILVIKYIVEQVVVVLIEVNEVDLVDLIALLALDGCGLIEQFPFRVRHDQCLFSVVDEVRNDVRLSLTTPAGTDDVDVSVIDLCRAWNDHELLFIWDLPDDQTVLELLQENPQHPEALKKLEARSIYWQGTKEWLNSLQ